MLHQYFLILRTLEFGSNPHLIAMARSVIGLGSTAMANRSILRHIFTSWSRSLVQPPFATLSMANYPQRMPMRHHTVANVLSLTLISTRRCDFGISFGGYET